MAVEMRKTPLHEWHVDNGANMGLFAGYDMPLWYPHGVKKEHLSVICSAGLFDTSHMAVITVKGAGAVRLLQHFFSKDLERCTGRDNRPLTVGRSVYGLFLTPEGHVLDDAIVSQVADGFYMVVVNAGMGRKVSRHLAQYSTEQDIEIRDLTDQVGKIDIQGKNSARILAGILENSAAMFTAFPYFSFKGWYDDSLDVAERICLKDGTPVMLSRTGYTGEFGFELFVRPGELLPVWKMLLERGEEFSLQPCGLAARDSLRAGAVLPLSHQDIGDWPFANTPWPFAIADKGKDGAFTKKFVGSEALLSQQPDLYTLPFAGYDPRKIVVSGTSCVTDEKGEEIGKILTCTTDMAIGRDGEIIVSVAGNANPEDFMPRGLCCGFIRVNRKLDRGDIVFLTDGKRKIKVEIREDVRPDRTARCPMNKMI